jgi:DNA-binding transcriptional LysR family regulator
MNISLVRIQRFVTVAEHLSFTRAAAILRIDQPWLSRQIIQLEDYLGIILFERNGSRITLTPEGQEFYEVAREIEVAAQRVQNKVLEMTRRTRSELMVCVAYTTFSLEGRKRLLEQFAALRPDVTLDISAAEWTDEVIEIVKAGQADFGIAFGPIDDPKLETCHLQRLDATFAIPKDNPLAQKPVLELKDFAGQPLAIATKNTSTIGTTPRYSWILEAGAIPVHVPEGRRYVFEVAKQKQLCVACYTPADVIPDDFVKRSVEGPIPPFSLLLIRVKRTMSPSAERLWRLAHELGDVMPIPDEA